MSLQSKTLCAVAAVSVFVWLSAPAAAMDAPVLARPALLANFAEEAASADVRYAAARVLASADNQGLPFVIVDKIDARIFVFEANGQLRGASAALLGLASGDHSVPGIGQRALSRILPEERTTPAGRFLSQPGRNLQGEEVIWVNYHEGLAIHRLRPGNSQEQRLQRLASSTPGDNRISLGCVVVPVAFYESVVSPMLGKHHSVVYVLPETRPVQALFDGEPVGISQLSQP
ncbi:hypothetical protein [Polaromonas sp. SM01]|uniref:hypothetical protein n=1 Tax=Polaromonas sp. SM01 TaxID=3085630 RepID=UPI002980EAB5|nr:hypothetical protein [Polaromonas sp. SM01]MDW5443439.1 hypothetical protein [Polaromonas sp. SM01]